MNAHHTSKPDTKSEAALSGKPMATWSRVLITLALLFHFVAILSGVLAAPPSSDIQLAMAEIFAPYFGLIDQGYSYRYYSPAPPPTPVVKAIVHFPDGRADVTVRIPDRGLRPRLRYQRELAITNALAADVADARRSGEGRLGSDSQLARAFARHIGKTHVGASSVTLTLELHVVPDPEVVRDQYEHSVAIDLDDPSYYTVTERIGDFACDGL